MNCSVSFIFVLFCDVDVNGMSSKSVWELAGSLNIDLGIDTVHVSLGTD